jgi:hypothetical protein
MVRLPAIAGPRRYSSVNADGGMQCLPAPHVVRAELHDAVLLTAVLPARRRARRRCSGVGERATTLPFSGAHASSASRGLGMTAQVGRTTTATELLVSRTNRGSSRCPVHGARTSEGARRWRSTGLATTAPPLDQATAARTSVPHPRTSLRLAGHLRVAEPVRPTRPSPRSRLRIRVVPTVRSARSRQGDPLTTVWPGSRPEPVHTRDVVDVTGAVPCVARREPRLDGSPTRGGDAQGRVHLGSAAADRGRPDPRARV